MDTINYLGTLPFNEVVKYTENKPKGGIAFSGFPKQHPTDKSKLILIHDPLGEKPVIIEFKIEDVLSIEDVHSAVTMAGEGIRLVKLWIRKKAHGVILEPFEVSENIQPKEHIKEVRERLTRSASL